MLLDPQDTSYPSKYVRKNAAFALGEMAFPHEDVVAALVALLRSDDSVHVRATAATAIGTHPTPLHPTRSVRQMSARSLSFLLPVFIALLNRAQIELWSLRPGMSTAISGGVGRRARQLPGADTSERAGAAATCLLALLESLAVEDNRVGQDITQARKRVFLRHVYTKMDRLTKTGSGQT